MKNFTEAMTLLAKAQSKATPDKEMTSLITNNNVYTLLSAISVPSGHNIIASRWIFRVKADDEKKERTVVLG